MCKVFLSTIDSDLEKNMADYIHRDMPMIYSSGNNYTLSEYKGYILKINHIV